jgi:hypothetical protein
VTDVQREPAEPITAFRKRLSLLILEALAEDDVIETYQQLREVCDDVDNKQWSKIAAGSVALAKAWYVQDRATATGLRPTEDDFREFASVVAGDHPVKLRLRSPEENLEALAVI